MFVPRISLCYSQLNFQMESNVSSRISAPLFYRQQFSTKRDGLLARNRRLSTFRIQISFTDNFGPSHQKCGKVFIVRDCVVGVSSLQLKLFSLSSCRSQSLFQQKGKMHQINRRSIQSLSVSLWVLIFSPYRAVNTLRLGYTNQSVNAAWGNTRCLFSDPHKTHKLNYI